MEYMGQRLQSISEGALRIDIYPSGVLGGETECIEQLQNGVLAMTKTSSAPMEAFIGEMKVFGMPYLFRDSVHFWEVLEGPVGRELLRKGTNRQLLGLCYYDAGSRNFYTTDRMIRSPKDLEGLKIRVQNSPVAIRMVETLGGSPTPIAWGELYSALAQGTVDGAENNLPSFISNKHYEVCKYFSLDAHTRVPDILLIGLPVWQTLSPQEQQWLKQAADESSVFQRQLWAEQTAEALDRARELGVEVYEPDIKPFMETVAPMYADIEGTPIGGFVERIRQ
jgi:tripartite ATP-independent transporter DctP family solute receptor